jgi:hypothetical protein
VESRVAVFLDKENLFSTRTIIKNKRKKLNMTYEEEAVAPKSFVGAKQLLQECGIMLQPTMKSLTMSHQTNFCCLFLIQGCPKCNNFFTEDIQLTARRVIESKFFIYYTNYTNADVGTTSLFALSSLGDLLIYCRDDRWGIAYTARILLANASVVQPSLMYCCK